MVGSVGIVGGGPVGLFLACELGAMGVPVDLYERAARPDGHPKANTHSARSMELYRRHGIADAFRSAGLPGDHPTDVVYQTRLSALELHRLRYPSADEVRAAPHGPDHRWPTPEPVLRASQLGLEPLLRDRAARLRDVRIHMGRDLVALEQDDRGVDLAFADGRTACHSYVAGCDGGRSFVRRALGIGFEGEGGLDLDFMGGRMLATHLRAPGLADMLTGRPAWMRWAITPRLRAVLVAIDGAERWLFHVQLPPDVAPEDYDLAAALETAVGAPVDHEVLAQEPWIAGRALVAKRYVMGRVAIAGDAAHLFTPTGGMGVNTGIEDAANVAWKLAALHGGWGGPDLLATYEAERQPVARRNTGFALSLARAVADCPTGPDVMADGPDGEAARRAAGDHIAQYASDEFDHPGLQLGTRYDGSPLLPAGEAPVQDDPLAYRPTTAPGGRLPHRWIAPGHSTLDLAGHGFTLLDLAPGAGRAAPWRAAADRLGVPLTVETWANADAVASWGTDLLLVRPDQIVAWRADGGAVDPAAILTRATAHTPAEELVH